MQHPGGGGSPNELEVERMPDVGYLGPGCGFLAITSHCYHAYFALGKETSNTAALMNRQTL